MNKRYLLILLILTLQATTPAHAGLWNTIRNWPLVTAILGKQAEVNYTKLTRLPVEDARPWWQRWFDVSSWMKRSPQAASVHAEFIAMSNFPLSPDARERMAHAIEKLPATRIANLEQENKKLHSELDKVNEITPELYVMGQNLLGQAEQLTTVINSQKIRISQLLSQIETAEGQNVQLQNRIAELEQKDAPAHIDCKRRLSNQYAELVAAREDLKKALAQQNGLPNEKLEEIQKLLQQKQSDVDLLMAKLEREEKKEKDTKKALNQFESNLNGLFTRFSDTATRKLDVAAHKLNNNQARLAALTQHVHHSNGSKNVSNPELLGSWKEVSLAANTSSQLPEVRKESPEIDGTLQIDPAYYAEQVKRGKAYANAINTDQLHQIPQGTQQEFLQSIVAVGWHLYDLALEKNQGFTEGTFVIEDQNFKLYNFLMSYSKQHNPSIQGTLQDPLLHISDNSFAYPRDASHYVHLKNQFRSYGIDIRFGADQEAQPLLPALKRHILFGKIAQDGDNLIFIKFENYGISKKDVLNHAHEYAVAQLAKNNAIAGSIRYMASLAGYTIKTDSGDGRRKERIVPEFQSAFTTAINAEQSIDPEKKKLYIALSNLEGFKTLYYTPIAALPSIKALATRFEQDPKGYDYMHWRTGQEVILGQHDWVPRLAYNKQIAAAN